jgi:hypothetical protein
MDPHVIRIVEEKAVLDARLEKLNKFLTDAVFPALAPEEQERLTRQARIMKDYSTVLGERLAAFGK